MSKQRLTDKQLEVYCFMQEFFKENDQLPPTTQVATLVGSTKENATARANGHYYFRTLVSKGYLERNAVGGYRFTRERIE